MPHDPFLAGQVLIADQLQVLDEQGTYTPEIIATTTDPNLGDAGEAEGTWQRNGHWIWVVARFLFSGSGVDEGSGRYRFTIPFAADTSVLDGSTVGAAGNQLGGGRARDDSIAGDSTILSVQLNDANLVNAVAASGVSRIGAGEPWTWAAGDRISIWFSYLADPSGLP